VWEYVSVSGDVQHPGNFQWKSDLRLKDVIDMAQFLPTSERSKAEIVRLSADFRDRKLIKIDLTALLNNDASQNILLQPRDQIKVYTLYREAEVSSGRSGQRGEYEIIKESV
jgi:protein involved in polysaccharide export with SLBB domain